MSARCDSTQSNEHTVCSLRQSSGARPVYVSMYLLLHAQLLLQVFQLPTKIPVSAVHTTGASSVRDEHYMMNTA